MATKKLIEVDETSIVDLKAELFRKEQEFRKESGSSGAAKPKARTADSKKKLPVWKKQPKKNTTQPKTLQHQHTDGPSEEEKTLQKSRQMLEAKAALYEKMAKGEIEDNEEDPESGEGRYLVDFHKKIHHEVAKQQNDEGNTEDNGPTTPPPSCPEEEWVEYVDSLGRSRKCLRKDFKELQERDRELLPRKSSSPPTLLSDDMRREIIRKKWEEEEEEARNRPVGPVHYQNIQYNEVHNHGVGYYQFSKVEQERQKQMDALKKLREETLDQRSRIEKVKDRRKAALKARLAKVRARKRGKTEESLEDEEVYSLKEDSSIEETTYKNTEEMGNKEMNESSETRTSKEMAVGKSEREEGIKPTRHNKAQPSIMNTYFKKRRDERAEDFAPPSFYYETTNTEQTISKKPWRGSQGPIFHTKPDGDQCSRAETQTVGNVTYEMQHQESRVQQSVTQYPPYPPPPGYLLPPFQAPKQGRHNYPPLPLPPQEKFNFPPPGFPPFPLPQHYSTIPPPLSHPPWLPSPWQQFPGQLVSQSQVPSNTQKADNKVSPTSDHNFATRTANQIVADFVSSLRQNPE